MKYAVECISACRVSLSHLPRDQVLEFLDFLEVLWVFLHVFIIEEGLEGDGRLRMLGGNSRVIADVEADARSPAGGEECS